MNVILRTAALVGFAVLVARPGIADEPPKKLTPDERQELEAKCDELHKTGFKAYQAGKLLEAHAAVAEALRIAQRLYTKDDFPDGHAKLAKSLNNLAFLYDAEGKLAEAEPLYKEALAMQQRLFKGDHPDVAKSLTNLAQLYHAKGKLGDAELLLKDALAMRQRLFAQDHADVAQSLNNLAGIYDDQGRLTEAEPLYKEALAMNKRLFKDDHPAVAQSLSNLAGLYESQGKLAEVEPLYKDALEMRRRLFKGDHPAVAISLNNLAHLYDVQGRLRDAESLYKDALAMNRRLHDGDHVHVAATLNNLAVVYLTQGRLKDAEPLLTEALAMRKRLLPRDHPDIAQSLSNLAAVYDKEGKLSAAEPLFKDALAMRKRLFKSDHPDIAASLNGLAHLYRAQGKLRDAEPLYADALAMNKRLFTGDNVRVAPSMNNLASVYKELGKLAEAEPLNIEALAMYRRLFKGDHPDTAQSLNNLARTYQDQAKLVAAEPLFKEALAMRQRLFNGDHPDVAESLNNLGGLYDDQGKPAAAESYYRKALGMYTRLFNGDHPDVATALSNLAAVCKSQGKLSDAEPLFKDALAMRQRLFEGDHPDVVLSMSNLAGLYSDQGKLAKAETLDKDALVMMQRLFNGDHPNVAHCMQSLAASYWTLGKLAEAELVCKDTLAMRKRLMVAYAKQKSEGEALTLLSSQSLSRDGLLSIARLRSVELGAAYDSAASYAAVWSTKGMIARVYEEHQHRARAVSTDPALAKMLDELVDARRRRADLLLGMPTKDPATLKQRADDLKAHDDSIAKLNVDLFRQLPIAARPAKLDAATFADLQKSLPADAAVIDFVRYDFFQFDNTQPIGEKKKRIELYLAFVATKANVTWVDLDTAATIESAIAAWRQAIASGQEIPANLPAKVRELVWAKVRKNIPDGTRVVYIAPDMGLCSVPWAALPGDKPGTVLLEDFAIATIPHAQFLLDKLWDQEAVKNSPTAALVVGGVKYDAQVTDSKVGSPGNLPAGDLAPWVDLKYAAAEADSLAKSAREHKLQVRQLEGEQATGAALLSELPKARTAHIATHGFFADPSFRSAFQLDPKEFAMTRRGERIGRAALSPLLMTGLVLAGANRPETPGRGIVTGESLIDLDLSGLELAVLSACETGLGEVAGGEGVFGLQRAFHMAGTRDVIASLWKVNDAATAALMGEFYKALWDDKLEPVFALQKAQLAVYRADPKKFRELARRGPGWGDKDFDPDKLHINADGKNSPVLWAAFTLSGPGRLNPPASGQRTADDSEQKTTTSSASTESHAASEDESPAPRQQMLLAHWILVAFLGTAALFVLVVVLAVVAWRLLARRSRG